MELIFEKTHNRIALLFTMVVTVHLKVTVPLKGVSCTIYIVMYILLLYMLLYILLLLYIYTHV